MGGGGRGVAVSILCRVLLWLVGEFHCNVSCFEVREGGGADASVGYLFLRRED